MADSAGIRTINLPVAGSSAPTEVLVHTAEGLRRQPLQLFVNAVLAAAGLGNASEAIVIATLLAHGFTLDADGNLHLTQVEADVAAEIIRSAAYDAAQGLRIRAAYTRPRLNSYGSWFNRGTVVTGWAVTYVPGRLVPRPASLTLWLQGLAQAPAVARLHLDIYRVSATAAATAAPGTGTLVYQRDYAPADVLDDPPSAAKAQRSVFATPGLEALPADSAYQYVLTSYDAGSARVGTGIALGVMPGAGSTAADLGWNFQNNSWNGNSGLAVAFEIGEEVGAPQGSLAGPGIARIIALETRPLEWPALSALVPPLLLERGRASIVTPLNLVSFAKPGSVTVTDSVPIQAVPLALRYEYPRAVTVRRADNNALMVEGSDYVVDYTTGYISNPNAGTSYVVANVSYTADNVRYDSLWVDPQTGAIGNTAGAERGKDVVEFLPDIPLGMIRLYNVYVTAAHGATMVPVYEFRDGVHVAAEGEYGDWLRRMTARLPGLARKMRAGDTITICLAGDSIQAVGGQTQADWTVPNGPSRDNPLIFLAGTGIGQDVIDALPRYDHGDGLPGGHVHIGWVWHLARAIEACSNSTVVVLNLAVGGSALGTVAPDANSVEMQAAYRNADADLYLTNFGMNSLSNSIAAGNVYNQTIALFRQLKQYNGGEIIDMPVVLTPQIGQIADLSEWWGVNNAKIRAAEDERVAYVPAGLVCDPDNLGMLGLARNSLCISGKKNHPGPREFALYARPLRDIVRAL